MLFLSVMPNHEKLSKSIFNEYLLWKKNSAPTFWPDFDVDFQYTLNQGDDIFDQILTWFRRRFSIYVESRRWHFRPDFDTRFWRRNLVEIFFWADVSSKSTSKSSLNLVENLSKWAEVIRPDFDVEFKSKSSRFSWSIFGRNPVDLVCRELNFTR